MAELADAQDLGCVPSWKQLKMDAESDMIECGLIREYRTKQLLESVEKGSHGTKDAFLLLLNGEIRNYAWDKLYRKELFRDIRFPVGRNYEDVAIQHLLISLCKNVTLVKGCFYHYAQRSQSITTGYKIKDLTDKWLSYYERYEYAMGISYIREDEQMRQKLLRSLCGYAEAVWNWFYYSPKDQREKVMPVIREISRFYRDNIPFFGYPGMSLGDKFTGILIRSSSKASLALSYIVFQSYMRLFNKFDTNELVQ